MDCRVVVKHSSGEEVLRPETSGSVRALQMLRLRNNFEFLQERRRASTNRRSETERVDFGAAGDASSGGPHTPNMEPNAASSSLDEEDNPIPPEHRPRWCQMRSDQPDHKSPPTEVENVPYPSLLDDPILDTPAIWSSKDRSRLYMYQRNALQQAKNAEEVAMMGETSSQRRQTTETQQCFQGGSMLTAQSSAATSFQRSPSTSIQGCSTFSAEANLAASFQRNPALSMQANAIFSAKTNVAASFQKSPTSLTQGNSIYTAEANIEAIFKRSQASYQESLFSANSGRNSLFQSTPASSIQRSVILSDEERLVETLENTIFFPISTTSTTQMNSTHSLDASSSSSSFQGNSSSSLQGSSATSLQANMASSLQGNRMSFNGNSAHSLNQSPLSLFSNIVNRSNPASPTQSTHRFSDLITLPLYGRTAQSSSEALSFPQTVTQTFHGHEIIQRNLAQQVQSASEDRQSSLRGSVSLQEMPTGIHSTSASMFEHFRPMPRPIPENRAFAQNTSLTELMSVLPRLDRSQSFHDTTAYQETQMKQPKPSTSGYTMSVSETPFSGWQPLNQNLAQPGNGQPNFKCFGTDVGASGEEIVVLPSGEPTKKKRRHEKVGVIAPNTKLRKEHLPIPQTQENGFLYAPHDFPELPNRSCHGNQGHVDQQYPQCSTAQSSSESAMAMSIFQQHSTGSNSTDAYTAAPMLHGHNSDTDIVQLNCTSAQFGTAVSDHREYNRQLAYDLYCNGINRDDFEDDTETPQHERLWDRRMLWLDRTEYMFGPHVRQRLPANVYPMLNDEVFFYMFYQHCRDLSQLEAAERLYLKGWRYHVVIKLWIRKIQPMIPNCASFLQQELACYVDSNLYEVFNPRSWCVARHQLDIDESCLEGRPFVPARRPQ